VSITTRFGVGAVLALTLTVPPAISADASTSMHPRPGPVARELVSFAAKECVTGCGSGSTIGPDGALYVTDGRAGAVLRVDPRTGATTEFASGLPPAEADIGGAMDVAFIGRTPYVLVSLVGAFFGHPGVVDGIYRIERDGRATPIADIGAWSEAHPPATDFFIPTGVQYAMQRYGDGFAVTDGHHNRLLRVRLNGAISELAAFEDIVPTGLDRSGSTLYMAEAGPVPHLPETGKIVALRPPTGHRPIEVASGAPLLVDVEVGAHGTLYGLSQGNWDWPNVPENAGLPATRHTGALVKAARGRFTTVLGGIDQPTSFELVDDTAFVVTFTGTVVRIDNV
jgi:hypothetical protein